MERYPKWIGGEPRPARWSYKKDIPVSLPAIHVTRVNFGLWGLAYIAEGQAGVIMPDGAEMPVHKAWLRTGGHVIGRQDLSIADGYGYDYGAEWRASLGERLLKNAGLGL